jgi:hypothetical protein
VVVAEWCKMLLMPKRRHSRSYSTSGAEVACYDSVALPLFSSDTAAVHRARRQHYETWLGCGLIGVYFRDRYQYLWTHRLKRTLQGFRMTPVGA